MGLIPTFIDLETAYSQEYSLDKMTTAAYILDPRFELICASIKNGLDDPATCYWGDDAIKYLQSLDWSQRMWISHHVKFDGSVAAWRLGIHPFFYGCTMALAQVMTAPYCGRASLAATLKYLQLASKGDEVIRAKGKWRRDFTHNEAVAYMNYCNDDNEGAADIWRILAPNFPVDEARIVDAMTRMFIYPRFQIDPAPLAQHIGEVRARKQGMLESVGMTSRDDLMSNDKFAALLVQHGVEPPRKANNNGELIYAFAKTDGEFLDLLDSDDELVANLVAARLGHKTTIAETRAERFLDVWKMTQEHWAPVPLRYAAALTHRAGGTDSQNWQNLGRSHPWLKAPDGKALPNPIRQSIVAPPGFKIVTVDAAQIELRLLMWQAGQHEMLDVLASGRSAYIEFGNHLFARTITKAEIEEYTLAKIGVLSCGYASSGSKFKGTARAQSGGLLRLSDAEADRVVRTYRHVNYRVPQQWRKDSGSVDAMCDGLYVDDVIDGQRVFWTELQALHGPTDLMMVYPSLRRDPADHGNYLYDYGRVRNKRLYGAKVTENKCQFLARVLVYAAQLRIQDRLGLYASAQAHDELVYCVPDSWVEPIKPVLIEEMSRRPAWAPNLPLSAECNSGQRYSDCK